MTILVYASKVPQQQQQDPHLFKLKVICGQMMHLKIHGECFVGLLCGLTLHKPNRGNLRGESHD